MSLPLLSARLFHHSRWQDIRVLDELRWGLEEQGIPRRAICCDEHNYVLMLSELVVKSSTLRADLGLNATGDIVSTHAQLPEDRALIREYIRAEAAQLRALGANADQLVKVLPLSEIN